MGTIILISIGTLASTVVIAVQKRGRLGERLSQRVIYLTNFFACVSFTDLPLHLQKEKEQNKAFFIYYFLFLIKCFWKINYSFKIFSLSDLFLTLKQVLRLCSKIYYLKK